MSEHDTYGQAGDWLIGAAKRNPEALLVLAAGAALFLRGRNGQASPSRSHGAQTSPSRSYYDDEASRQPTSSRASGALSRVADSASGLAEGAKDYASDVTERISSTAGSYASTVSKFADDARQTVTSQASRFADQAQSTMQQGFAQRQVGSSKVRGDRDDLSQLLNLFRSTVTRAVAVRFRKVEFSFCQSWIQRYGLL